MVKRYFINYILLLISSLFIFGCGGGSISSTSPSSEDNIEVESLKSLISLDKREFYLEFSMKSNYSSAITLELSDISVDLNACKVLNSTLDVLDGKLKLGGESREQTVTLVANFIKPCTPTSYRVEAINSLNYSGTTNVIDYKSDYKPITIDGNITHEDVTSIFDYGVQLKAQDVQSKVKLDSRGRYKLFFVNLDHNATVKKERVHSITIRSSDPSKAKLIDPKNYNSDGGTPHDELMFEEDNEIDLYIQTYNSSGIVNFDVDVNYTNNRGELHDLQSRVSIVVLSGEPTAFSINSAGISYNEETKWLEHKFLVSASDKYNNPVNISSIINVTAMADFTRDSSGKRILYGKFSNIKGSLEADSGSHTATFKSSASVLSSVDTDRDFLFLFGHVKDSEALGKWDIDPYNHSSNSLGLTNSYYGSNHSNLSFAVGHNYYNEICSSESREWELKIDSTDGTYKLDEEGKTYVTLKAPMYMVGKRVALSVNFSGKEKRSGEVHFETIRTFQGVIDPETITIESNTTVNVVKSFPFKIDTGTSDIYPVLNAKVICEIDSNNIDIVGFEENREVKSIKDCGNSTSGEIAYWSLTLRLVNLDNPGEISFKNCQVDSFLDKF